MSTVSLQRASPAATRDLSEPMNDTHLPTDFVFTWSARMCCAAGVSNAGGAKWWLDFFDSNCTAMYGSKCKFDFGCTHAYFYPEDTPGQGCDGLPDWVRTARTDDAAPGCPTQC